MQLLTNRGTSTYFKCFNVKDSPKKCFFCGEDKSTITHQLLICQGTQLHKETNCPMMKTEKDLAVYVRSKEGRTALIELGFKILDEIKLITRL